MGKVIIELADSMELKIRAKNLTDAIEKLIEMRNNKAGERNSSLVKFRGIARYKDTENEEEWYRQ